MPIIKREHFNRWYSSGAYYLSIIISDIPITIACTSIYMTLIYFLTAQPPDSFRFFFFLLIGTLTNFCAQSWGLLIGSLFSAQVNLHNVLWRALIGQLTVAFHSSSLYRLLPF